MSLPAVILAILFFWPATWTLAQAPGTERLASPMAMLRGIVQDQAGVPIPEVMVTATNLSTGQDTTARSNRQGQFEIGNILIEGNKKRNKTF